MIENKGDLISRDYVEKIISSEFVDLQDGTEEWRTYVNDTCENILNKVHNAPTYNQVGHVMATAEGFCTDPAWNKLDCDNCEGKAFSYSMGLKDGYLLGGFQLTELRRWLTSQGYSEGTVDDKINEFTRFVEKIRGEEK